MRRKDAAQVLAMVNAAFARMTKPAPVVSSEGVEAVSSDMPLLEWGRKMLPEYAGNRVNELHVWLAEQCDRARRRRNHRVNLLGPRGAAKSVVGVTWNILRAACEGTDPTIWIIAETKEQAQAQLETIKEELEDNDRLARAYPWACGKGKTWRMNKAVLRNGVSIEAFGMGQALRGRRKGAVRPSLIVCDDLQGDKVMVSPKRRQTERDKFFGVVTNAGDGRTNIFNLGTALHREAVGSILDDAAGWVSQRFRAVKSWPADMEKGDGLWARWRTIIQDRSIANRVEAAYDFFKSHESQMTAGSEVLWPDRANLYSLMLKREETGHQTFEREQQAREINPEACEWGDALFGDSIWYRKIPEDVYAIATALDPSKGRSDKIGDYSAIVTGFMGRSGILYVRCDMARRPIAQMLADLVRECAAWKPTAVGIEVNAWQELLCAPFEAACHNAGVIPPLIIPIENMEDKKVRIRRLDPWLSTGRIRFLADHVGTRMLVQQLCDFPIGDHDDGPDALEMMIRIMLNVMGVGGFSVSRKREYIE